MMAKIKSKKFLLGAITVIVAGVLVVFGMTNQDTQRLSEDQIMSLREEYPICGIEQPFNGTMATPSINQVKDTVDTFIYGTVVSDMETFTRNVSTGNPELDAKRQSHGLSSQYEFYEYTISVIEDTSGLYKAGDQLTIASNMDFIDFNPHLSKNMNVVVPVVRDKKEPARNYFGVFGMYYVTTDGYALSAFEENTMKMDSLSGVKVDALLNELRSN